MLKGGARHFAKPLVDADVLLSILSSNEGIVSDLRSYEQFEQDKNPKSLLRPKTFEKPWCLFWYRNHVVKCGPTWGLKESHASWPMSWKVTRDDLQAICAAKLPRVCELDDTLSNSSTWDWRGDHLRIVSWTANMARPSSHTEDVVGSASVGAAARDLVQEPTNSTQAIGTGKMVVSRSHMLHVWICSYFYHIFKPFMSGKSSLHGAFGDVFFLEF